MRKIFVLIPAVLIFLPAAAASFTGPEFRGHQWVRYSFEYNGRVPGENSLKLPRTYLRWDFKDVAENISGKITVEISGNNSNEESGRGVWLEKGYFEVSGLPAPGGAAVNFRAGVQPVYFGTLDVWDYPLIEGPFEESAGFMDRADLGAALVGTAVESLMKYEIGVYNGSGYRHIDGDEYKNIIGSLQFNLLGVMFFRISLADNNEMRGDSYIFAFETEKIKGYCDYLRGAEKSTADGENGGSGVFENGSFYFGASVLENFWINFRFDNMDPDTGSAGNITKKYISGIRYIFSDKMELQINYTLEKSYGEINRNLWEAQARWGW